jgi:hypothetical protein
VKRPPGRCEKIPGRIKAFLAKTARKESSSALRVFACWREPLDFFTPSRAALRTIVAGSFPGSIPPIIAWSSMAEIADG